MNKEAHRWTIRERARNKEKTDIVILSEVKNLQKNSESWWILPDK